MSREEKIWLSPPHIGKRELELVHDAFASNWVAPLGPHLDAFEQELSAYLGVPHVAAVSSGTAALHLALLLLGVERDDEVIVSSLTFAASANPILYQSALPVFVDCEEQSWNISPDFLEEALRERSKRGKKPKAVIAVDLYGMPCDYERIGRICESFEVPLIEDAAEALGSRYRGERLGGFGTIGILSFNGNKIITTSGGGALLSEDAGLISRAKFLATQARDDAPHYQHSTVGYNYRLSNVLAAIGRGQLEKIEQRVEERRRVFEYYRSRLQGIEGISFVEEGPASFSNRWLTTILIDPALTNGRTRETIREALLRENIESRPIWKPLHLQPVFSGYPFFGNGTAERLFERGLCLPSGSALTEEQLERILAVILRDFG